jgi:hypothetical protein
MKTENLTRRNLKELDRIENDWLTLLAVISLAFVVAMNFFAFTFDYEGNCNSECGREVFSCECLYLFPLIVVVIDAGLIIATVMGGCEIGVKEF